MRRRARRLLAGIAAAAISAAGRGHADSMTLGSDAIQEGKPIPIDYACDGADHSPPLHWERAPQGTRAFAVIVDDPDAPSGNWNHWLLYNVPAAAGALAAKIPAKGTLGDGSRQGTNDFGRIGYGGPCPPTGSTHRYVFRIYALCAPLGLRPGAKREAVLEAIKDKTIGQAELTGRYGR